MSDVPVPECIKKFVIENSKMESLVSCLVGETYDLYYHTEQEHQYDNELISDVSISSETHLHNLSPSPYGYRLHPEPQDLMMHPSTCSPDINNNHHQQTHHNDWSQCYPAPCTIEYNKHVLKTDTYSPVYTGYDQYQPGGCGSYRDAESYDSDASVEVSEDCFCIPPSICQNLQIKTEKSNKTRLPAFGEFFSPGSRHNKGSRGRPVTYRRPGSNFVDSDDLDSEEDDRMSLSPGSSKVRRGAKNILLWKFLLEELVSKEATHVQWVNRREGTFKFVDTAECSKLWGRKKKKDDMNFEKLSRGIRHYYRDGLMSRLDGTRLVYKFNWDRVPKAFRKLAKVY